MTTRYKDMTGQKIGMLTFLEYSHIEKKITYWRCSCDCGKACIAAASEVRRGRKSSCGCLHTLRNIEKGKANSKDITGQQFSYLTAIEPTDKRSGNMIIWKCLCKCGNICYVSGKLLRNGETKSCGCLTISKLHMKTRNILLKYDIEFWEEQQIPFKKLRLDFYAVYNDTFFGIECQGKQHYEPVSIFGGEEGFVKTQQRDEKKLLTLNGMNTPLIYIPYTIKNEDLEEFILHQIHNVHSQVRVV